MVVADNSKEEEEMVPTKKRKVSEEPAVEEKHGKMDVVLALPSIYHSTCERCIFPPICNKCGVLGDISAFCCWGCQLLILKDLHHCDACGRAIVTQKYWCKDCATKNEVTKFGVCFVCGYSPCDVIVDDEVVPETEE
jgi:hypothetical protein